MLGIAICMHYQVQQYALTHSYSGNIPINNGTVTFIDPIPADTGLVVTDIAATGSDPSYLRMAHLRVIRPVILTV